MTKQQKAAIAKLRAMRDAGQLVPSGKYRTIATGVNTSVLHGLHKLGVIKCRQIFLRGNCADDLQVFGS